MAGVAKEPPQPRGCVRLVRDAGGVQGCRLNLRQECVRILDESRGVDHLDHLEVIEDLGLLAGAVVPLVEHDLDAIPGFLEGILDRQRVAITDVGVDVPHHDGGVDRHETLLRGR